MKIYAASSWGNHHYDATVKALRKLGQEVYDYRQVGRSFNWEAIETPPELYQQLLDLEHPAAALCSNVEALYWCDILILPSGPSAHLEAGFTISLGKPTAVYAPDEEDTVRMELAHGMAHVTAGWEQLRHWLVSIAPKTAPDHEPEPTW